MTGTFVAFDGPDGSGKTTQVRMLARRLEGLGRPAVVVREPGGTPLAEEVRDLLLHAPHDIAPNAEALLFQVARADLVARVIRPALEQGRTVLADRFALSTRCYQVAGRRLEDAGVAAAIALATGGLAPHLYLVLDVAADEGRRRQQAEGKGPDRLERADKDFHDRVAQAFRNATGPSILHLNAEQAPEAIHAAAWRVLAERFPEAFPG